MLLDAKLFSHNEKTNTYSVELSTLQVAPGKWISSFTLINCPKEGQHRTFKYLGPDISNEEIAGYNYIEMDGPNKGRSYEKGHPPVTVPPIKVLLIND
jgi:hypothetical protein